MVHGDVASSIPTPGSVLTVASPDGVANAGDGRGSNALKVDVESSAVTNTEDGRERTDVTGVTGDRTDKEVLNERRLHGVRREAYETRDTSCARKYPFCHDNVPETDVAPYLSLPRFFTLCARTIAALSNWALHFRSCPVINPAPHSLVLSSHVCLFGEGIVLDARCTRTGALYCSQ